jgi:flagellar hook-associated protein 2
MASTTSTSGLQLSGLASGIDWTSIVNELTTIERAPETQMNSQITSYNNKKSAYTQIGTYMTSLAADIKNLSDPSFFDNRTATPADTTVATATVSSGAPVGTYTLDITKLASNAVQQGTTATASALSPTNDVSSLVLSGAGFGSPVTAGTFTVNGQTVTIATSDTLQSVFDKISTATGGAITAGYDHSTDEISLNSSSNIVLGSATDTSNFLQVAQLYNNGSNSISSVTALGSINLSNDLTAANFSTAISDGGSGAGEMVINGVTINYNASTDSVNDVLQRISDSAAGVTASYDAVNKRFLLTNKTTGDVGISMQDVAGHGNFLAATGLSGGSLVRGTNLQYSINNGSTLTSLSNTVDSTSSGITGLSFTALAQKSTTITVASDNNKISSAVGSFVGDYNNLQNYITSQTKSTASSTGSVTAGLLTGDLDVEGMAQSLRNLVSNVGGSATGSISGLGSLGVDSNGNDNTLALSNPSLLVTALNNNLAGVKQFFTDAASGIGTRLQAYVTDVNGSKGLLATDETNFSNEVTHINTSISSLEARIGQDTTRLTNEFVAMENAISQINTQKQYLNSFFSTSASTTAAPVAAGSNQSTSSSSGSTSSSSATG